MTEQELIQRAKNGDTAAFGELIAQNEGKVYGLTFRMTKNREDAQDLAQEAFLNAWRGLKNFQGDSSFSTWVYRLATNACIDHIRKQKRRHDLVDAQSLDDDEFGAIQLPDSRYDPHQELEKKQLQQAVERGLQALPDNQRQVLVMRELSELSYQEIGDALDMDLGTVKSRISRGRLALRKILLADGNFFGRPTSKPIEESREEGAT